MTLRPEKLSFNFLNMPEVDKLLITPEKKEMKDTNKFSPFKVKFFLISGSNYY